LRDGGEAAALPVAPHGTLSPGWFDRAVIAITSRMPDNWVGLRLSIGLRRLVMMRLYGDDGFDVQRWGLRLRLHPRRNGCEKGLLFTPQMYEVTERSALSAQIEAAAAAGRPFVFVDIGANVGLFSFFVAARTGGNARILAIEPDRQSVGRLQFNLAANPGLPIQVFAHALDGQAGDVVIQFDDRDRGGTRAVAGVRRAETPDQIVVQCRTLLDVLGQAGVQSIDALKIDVEGMEDAILVPFFDDAPRELWPKMLIIEDAGAAWQIDLLSRLQTLGYSVAARSKLNVVMCR
jgi:FkbM family methyltransferase